MSAHDEMEVTRDRFVQQWLSRVVQQDVPHEPMLSSERPFSRNIPDYQHAPTQNSRRRYREDPRQPGDAAVRTPDNPRIREHRTKRRCVEKENIRRPPSNSPRRTELPTLESPFRHFTKRDHPGQVPAKAGTRPRLAAVSSSPTPYVRKKKVIVDHECGNPPTSSQSCREQINLDSASENFDERGMIKSTSAAPNLGKEYGRRPRHKTRPDRYEPKETRKSSTKPAKRDKKKPNAKKGRQRLSKTAIGEEFKAPNVKQDRITLASNHGLGLFRNGKASSPKRRRELPDLSFSEMGFLAKQKYPESQTTPKVSTAKEISQYFSRQPPIEKGCTIVSDKKHPQPSQPLEGSHISPNLRQTAMLGSTRAPKADTCLPANQYSRSISTSTIPSRHGITNRLPRTDSDASRNIPNNAELTERSTTYYTWSESNHRVADPSEPNEQLDQTVLQGSAPVPANNSRSSIQEGRSSIGEDSSHLPLQGGNGSATQLESRARDILLKNTDLANPSKGDNAEGVQNYLTLDDLHDLADTGAAVGRGAKVGEMCVGIISVEDNPKTNNGTPTRNSPPSAMRAKLGQDKEGYSKSTIGHSKEVPVNLSKESSRPAITEAQDPTKKALIADATQGDYDICVPTGLEGRKQIIETGQHEAGNTHRIRFGDPLEGLISNNRTDPISYLEHFTGVRDCRPHFLVDSMREIANGDASAVSMSTNRPFGMRTGSSKQPKSPPFDPLGLDTFDREVLRLEALNPATYPTDNPRDCSPCDLPFLLSTAPESVGSILSLLPRDVSPYFSDAVLAEDPTFGELDWGIASANNAQDLDASVHNERYYMDLAPNSSKENYCREVDYSGGEARTSRATENLRHRTQDPVPWIQLHSHYGRGTAQRDSRTRLPWITTGSGQPRGQSVGSVGMAGGEHDSTLFWRPNRLY